MIDDPPSSRRFWREFTMRLTEAMMSLPRRDPKKRRLLGRGPLGRRSVVIVVPPGASAARVPIERAVKEGWLVLDHVDDQGAHYRVLRGPRSRPPKDAG